MNEKTAKGANHTDRRKELPRNLKALEIGESNEKKKEGTRVRTECRQGENKERRRKYNV